MKNSNLLLLLTFMLAVCSTLSCQKATNPDPALEITLKGTARIKCPLTFHSSLQADSYAWNFGDGTRSASAAPVHTYTAAGTYAAKLYINGDSSKIVSKNISIGAACTINYSGARITGGAIVFGSNADTSSKLQWDFGDGITSSVFSPTHIFNSPSGYVVKLIVDGQSSDPVFAVISIFNDPIYTHSMGRLRNWHHVNSSIIRLPPYYTNTYEDISFAINYIDPVTVSLGDTFFYKSTGPGDMLTFGWHNFPILSEYYGYIYYFPTTDSIAIYKHVYIAGGHSIDDSFNTY